MRCLVLLLPLAVLNAPAWGESEFEKYSRMLSSIPDPSAATRYHSTVRYLGRLDAERLWQLVVEAQLSLPIEVASPVRARAAKRAYRAERRAGGAAGRAGAPAMPARQRLHIIASNLVSRFERR